MILAERQDLRMGLVTPMRNVNPEGEPIRVPVLLDMESVAHFPLVVEPVQAKTARISRVRVP